jgi:hypothetical protein
LRSGGAVGAVNQGGRRICGMSAKVDLLELAEGTGEIGSSASPSWVAGTCQLLLLKLDGLDHCLTSAVV